MSDLTDLILGLLLLTIQLIVLALTLLFWGAVAIMVYAVWYVATTGQLPFQ